ncbi:hypothetical protein DICPUDRAFT_152622 [Dictyostelium purpureum]|uniref:Uncharacterized protein n=1 Tax=Dictyostelium purpureum TaxID=5786 RepID=F0ZLV3_DICPU|nr:uncharacterized protein DICPUDRAFT_152622 [Dictyostelium purpureum]EGC35080.1 hypothetical protein DICPUDRAFT_152622 [Dictyostelium purpureum]|eukprot:XP_003288387.1 hypothetical protein DICPUDRAFT_152622 [Dictyostelium purpureum]
MLFKSIQSLNSSLSSSSMKKLNTFSNGTGVQVSNKISLLDGNNISLLNNNTDNSIPLL